LKEKLDKLIKKVYVSRTEMDSLKKNLRLLADRVSTLEVENNNLKEEVHMLSQCVLDMHLPIDYVIKESRRPELLEHYLTIEQCYDKLKEEAPVAFCEYMKLMDNNINCYVGEPINSCSVEGHKEAKNFTKFICRYLRGFVLDIGCGPQAMPIYLENYPIERIFALDPLLPHKEHPFEFKQGISEYIPWKDNSFDNIIFATSLDHVFLLERVWDEVSRVLKKGGTVLIWTSFDENAPKYNPYRDDFVPYDGYHMFHHSRLCFEEEMKERFELVEYYKSNYNNHFYAYTINKGVSQ